WFGDKGVALVLIAASAVFLGAGSLYDLFLLVLSIVVNFALVSAIWRAGETTLLRRTALVVGIAFNVFLLTYFKVYGEAWSTESVHGPAGTLGTLPLAISFYTFHQIAFLVDMSAPDAKRVPFERYALFVGFFPQLVSGPIVRWDEVKDQLSSLAPRLLKGPYVALGTMLLIAGLAKKTLIADRIGSVIAPVYAGAGDALPTMGEAWSAAFGFAFQVYFDFSAYSDIAIGVGLMFGIFLPVNFLSPFKASSIRVFWITWHITFSRFLRDYVYNPLGGRSRFAAMRLPALSVAMLISGVWHGLGWTFTIFGLLSGLFIVLSQLRKRRFDNAAVPNGVYTWIGRTIVMFAFAVTIILFRSPDIATAGTIYYALFSGAPTLGLIPLWFAIALPCLAIFLWLLPNTAELFGQLGTPLERQARSQTLHVPVPLALSLGVLFGVVLLQLWGSDQSSEFIYFAF
ncbi:MAG: MBOAT family protein, partial [Flavobacteriaceae bacterium]